MLQNLQNFVKFQKIQLDNLVDFEKCCKTRIFLQKSEPIQPKTSNILPKFCQPTLLWVHEADVSFCEPRLRRSHAVGGHRRRDGLAPPRDAACQRGSGGKGRLLGRVLYFFAAVYIRSFDCN